jgi:hypothetical protein
MKFVKNAMAEAKCLPKSIWIAAVVVPGGLTAVGVWLIARGTYRSLKGKK